MKTEIYNLIILDESGSMSPIVKQTINGCNETLNTIRSAQKEYAASQTHYVSIFVFQSNASRPSHYLVKNRPIDEVEPLTETMYEPYGGTPLYDAVGSTLTDLKAIISCKELALGNVTIITDGEENTSHHYSGEKVMRMISEVRELGWSVNFIGANIDVKAAAATIGISNSYTFEQTASGTEQMFEKESQSRQSWYRRTAQLIDECACEAPGSVQTKQSLRKKLKESADKYFNADKEDKA